MCVHPKVIKIHFEFEVRVDVELEGEKVISDKKSQVEIH